MTEYSKEDIVNNLREYKKRLDDKGGVIVIVSPLYENLKSALSIGAFVGNKIAPVGAVENTMRIIYQLDILGEYYDVKIEENEKVIILTLLNKE